MKTLDPRKTAVISVDNTKTFEDPGLNELLVGEGLQAAKYTKKLLDLAKKFGILTVNVLEKHPSGHISFSSSYKNKEQFDEITYEEVKDWTEDDNGLSEKAGFNIEQLKARLKEVLVMKIRPDHAVEGTEGVKMTPPLNEDTFDITVVKATEVDRDAASGFDGTDLVDQLKDRGIEAIILAGVAAEVCVFFTAIDGVNYNFVTYWLKEAVGHIDPNAKEKLYDQLIEKGIIVITTNKLKELLNV